MRTNNNISAVLQYATYWRYARHEDTLHPGTERSMRAHEQIKYSKRVDEALRELSLENRAEGVETSTTQSQQDSIDVIRAVSTPASCTKIAEQFEKVLVMSDKEIAALFKSPPVYDDFI